MISLIPSNDKRILLRTSNSLIVPYVPLQLYSEIGNSVFYEIKVGPNPNGQLALDSASFIFSKAHIENGISISTIPYRNW